MWTEVSAFIVAVGGVIGGLFAAVRNLRGDRFKREVEASAALLTGYTEMVSNLRDELNAVRAAHQQDREQWANERRDLHREIEALRDEVAELMSRPRTSRTRTDD